MSGPNVTLGVIAPYADDVITSRAALTEFCGVLEECGVESVWTVEHVLEADAYEPRYPYSDDGRMPRRFVPMADPLELLAFFAALTTTITLGTSVVVAPLHSPVVLAKRASTLANLSGGRFELGLGIGWQKEEYASVGVPYADRGVRLDECIGAMRALWADRPASFDGRFVSFERVHSLPTPPSGRVPIVLGGNSRPAVARCARTGDGWFPHAISHDDFAAGAALLRALAQEAGRSPDDIPISICPGSTDYARAFDVDFVRPYVEHGAHALGDHHRDRATAGRAASARQHSALPRRGPRQARMINVLDVLTVQPGALAEVRTRVRDVYAPAIEVLGARLAQTWIAPPVELHDDPIELLLLWECTDTAAYWQVRVGAARSSTILAFWRDLEPLLVSRTRRIMVDPDDTSVLR